MIVYLAGGMHSGWQDKVIGAVSHECIDPRSHGLEVSDAYTAWDLSAIRVCDIVFAYMEKENPSGAGLAFEAGYAKALGKIVIFVEDVDLKIARHFGMVRAAADVVCIDLDDGIEVLKSFERR